MYTNDAAVDREEVDVTVEDAVPGSPEDALAAAEDALAAIEVANGSVAGAMHRRVGRPNQDAASVVRTRHGLALAVCDGCGSGARSEIGAAVGARLWTAAIAERLARGQPLTAADLDALAATVLARLAVVADALGPDRAAVTRDHLLFTSVCAAITADQVAVLAIGDGVIALGDDLHVLGPFADNQPPYLTEAWFGVPRAPTVWLRPRRDLTSLILATDGAAALVDDPPVPTDPPDAPPARPRASLLAQLAATDLVYRNPQALTRRLSLLAADQLDIDWYAHRTVRRPARLDDDTTVVCARWSAP